MLKLTVLRGRLPSKLWTNKIKWAMLKATVENKNTIIYTIQEPVVGYGIF